MLLEKDNFLNASTLAKADCCWLYADQETPTRSAILFHVSLFCRPLDAACYTVVRAVLHCRTSYDRLVVELGIRSVVAGDSHKAAQRAAAAAEAQ